MHEFFLYYFTTNTTVLLLLLPLLLYYQCITHSDPSVKRSWEPSADSPPQNGTYVLTTNGQQPHPPMSGRCSQPGPRCSAQLPPPWAGVSWPLHKYEIKYKNAFKNTALQKSGELIWFKPREGMNELSWYENPVLELASERHTRGFTKACQLKSVNTRLISQWIWMYCHVIKPCAVLSHSFQTRLAAKCSSEGICSMMLH